MYRQILIKITVKTTTIVITILIQYYIEVTQHFGNRQKDNHQSTELTQTEHHGNQNC